MMQWLGDLFGGFAALFGASASLWIVFLLAVLLWTLIIERYWYFYFQHGGVVEIAQRRWQRWTSVDRRLARRARRHILVGLQRQTHRFLALIESLVPVILLTGLTGSVAGVIRVLDSLSYPGAGGQRLVAQGLTAAAVPVATALAVVLVSLFFTRALRDRADVEVRLVADRLRRG